MAITTENELHEAELENARDELAGIESGAIDARPGRKQELQSIIKSSLESNVRTADQWWAWHDQDSARWSSDTAEAESRCAAWLAGESDDGPSS